MKKKINTDAIRNELAGSVFFPARPAEPPAQHEERPVSDHHIPPPKEISRDDTLVSRYHDTVIPGSEEEMIEAVRKAAKQLGREPATQRLTLEEKQALADIEYRYQKQGIKTSGNEIIRIATNYVVRDYQKNGATSILAHVLQKLNS